MDFSSDSFMNSKADALHFGPALIAQRIFERRPIDDANWIKSVVLTLFGFAVYQYVVRKYVSTDSYSGSARLALDDILKFGTMLIVLRITSRKSIMDKDWIKETAAILAGLVIYDFGTIRLYDTSTLQAKHKAAVDDVIKFGTMFVAAEALTDREFSAAWATSVAGFLVGLTVYNFFLIGF